MHDVLVVGGGPVGLHAALKAAVLRQEVLVLDKGAAFSRVSQAPAIANVPGAPGISGRELLARGRDAIRRFEEMAGARLVAFREGWEAVSARRVEGGFAVRARRMEDGREEELRARVLVLATGVVDRKPGIEGFAWRGHETLAPFVHHGGIGYCLLCEGWSLEGREVAVVGCSEDAAGIARDVRRHFRGEVALLTDGARLQDEETAARLRDAGVRVDARPLRGMRDEEGRVRVAFAEGAPRSFDKVFFSLGWYKVNNELAVQLGAATTSDGYVRTDENSEAVDARGRRIPGLFAVGDVRAGRWKQVVVGWGDAETAAITAYAYRLPDEPNEDAAATLKDEGPGSPTMANDSEYSEKAREFISRHVEKHMEEDGMKQERAVAAAMNEAREKGYKVPDKED